MKELFLFFIVITVYSSCNIVENKLELLDQEPTLLKTVSNGQKFLIGDPTSMRGDYLYIANLKGTPYEMGKALGELYTDEILSNLGLLYGYYLGQL